MRSLTALFASPRYNGRLMLWIWGLALALLVALLPASVTFASDAEKPVTRDYRLVFAPPAPRVQDEADVRAKSDGCTTCHVATEAPTMHMSSAVQLGCTDCHGGNASVKGNAELEHDSRDYVVARDAAHVLPKYPQGWHFPSSANPKLTYTLLNKESPEFVRFINPSDYRVARLACGECHIEVIEASERSIMASGAMLWGGASYNNGILPFKNYLLGEAYTSEGEPAKIMSPGAPHGTVTDAEAKRGALGVLYPLPTWHVTPPGDIFRVFERGGRNIGTQFPEIGLPNIGGIIQRLEEPGRPDLKQSNRGPATGLRVAIPVLNIHKTRLNDPFTWFMGTNDQPGDYRHSGCASCHVIYANDREPRHSLGYSTKGRDGQSDTADPTIRGLKDGTVRKYVNAAGELVAANHDDHGGGHAAQGSHGALKQPDGHGEESDYGEDAAHGDDKAHGNNNAHGDGDHGEKKAESGHPIGHVFTRAIPTAQCMNCHMHQPNIFLNSYLGYTMWDYESDAKLMWPNPENPLTPPPYLAKDAYKTQKYPTAAEAHAILDRNPEAASVRGLWGDVDFLRNVYDDVNPLAKDTQFADYHGHGWNFRAIFKRDREGNLLDKDGKIVPNDDPEKFKKTDAPVFVQPGEQKGKAVHMMDIHAEKGLQCADCHFAQDSHGNGLIYGEVANAVEIGCKDCHGTADAYPTLLTSNVAARPQGTNLALLRNADGRRRFEWYFDATGNRVLIQRSIVDPKLEWRVSLVKDSVTEGNPHFNATAARAKLMSKAGAGGKYGFGPGVAPGDRAHGDDNMTCFTCHLSWTTSCGGCHLPIEANWKTKSHKYDGIETRNFATYNPQVARDDMYQLGKHQTTKGNIIAPVRSTSALILSSTNINRERIYVQQPPISAAGFSSQAFAPHFPHTVRTTETKKCTDCHLSEDDDNNAIMSQLLLLGTNFVNFVGLHAWTGLQGGFEAVRVTEWDEPQAVIGSYLQKYAYPDFYALHVERNGRELKNWIRGKTFDKAFSGETYALEEFANVVQGTPGAVNCLQNRGEYMFVAEGSGGFRVYDIASIGNKGFSERILTAPFSKLGHDTRVKSKNATCMALSTTQPISVMRNDNMAAKEMKNPDGSMTNLRAVNQEQAFHPLYRYAVVTDSEEGLYLVDIDGMADGEFRNNFLKRAVTWNENGVLKGARHVTLGGHFAYITADAGLVVIDLDKPLEPRLTAVIPLTDARASALQFRYLWVTDAEGVKLFDVTELASPVAVPEATIRLGDARRLYLARTYAYVAAGRDGLVIMNITKPRAPVEYGRYSFGEASPDARDVIVGSTNASLFAYIADGQNGLKVIQLTSPDSQPNFYGFSPPPVPELIAFAKTPSPALALAKGLDRDRAVDETGGQMAIFGRLGSRPFTRREMEALFLGSDRRPYKVSDTADMKDWIAAPPMVAAR